MCGTKLWSWVLVSWVLVAALGQHMSDRTFLMAFGAVLVATTYASLRGPSWLEALRTGRQIERQRQQPPALSDDDTVDLTLYRQREGTRRSRAS